MQKYTTIFQRYNQMIWKIQNLYIVDIKLRSSFDKIHLAK